MTLASTSIDSDYRLSGRPRPHSGARLPCPPAPPIILMTTPTTCRIPSIMHLICASFDPIVSSTQAPLCTVSHRSALALESSTPTSMSTSFKYMLICRSSSDHVARFSFSYVPSFHYPHWCPSYPPSSLSSILKEGLLNPIGSLGPHCLP